MDYDVARAEVLLRDLERIGRGRAPGVQLAPPSEGNSAVCGTATRLGLLRLAARLGRAALATRSVVVIHDGGNVSENTAAPDAMVQLVLIDDLPTTRPRKVGWYDWLVDLYLFGVWCLSLIGLVTVVRWMTAR